MRLAAVNVPKSEGLALVGLVAGLVVFVAGYVSGVQSQTGIGQVATAMPIAQASADPVACPEPVAQQTAQDTAPAAAPATGAYADVMPARKVKARIFREEPRQ
jgi:hypothetical protein